MVSTPSMPDSPQRPGDSRSYPTRRPIPSHSSNPPAIPIQLLPSSRHPTITCRDLNNLLRPLLLSQKLYIRAVIRWPIRLLVVFGNTNHSFPKGMDQTIIKPEMNEIFCFVRIGRRGNAIILTRFRRTCNDFMYVRHEFKSDVVLFCLLKRR